MSLPEPTHPALVTGSSRGLGAALSLELARRGFHIIAVARTVGGLEELDDRIRTVGGSATLVPMDVTDDGAMQHLCKSTHDRWGGLSMWAHTAIHAAPLTLTPQIDKRDWKKSWDTNVEATRRMIAYCAPLLPQDTHARALFFKDDRAGEKFFGSYGATKAAQISLAESWRAESERIGPGVHVLSPNPMPTATRARFFPGEAREDLLAPDHEAVRLLASLDS